MTYIFPTVALVCRRQNTTITVPEVFSRKEISEYFVSKIGTDFPETMSKVSAPVF